VRQLEVFDDHGLVFGMSMPLGVRTRAAYSMAESDAQLAASQLRRTAAHAESYQLLFENYQELLHARTEHEALRASMLPKAEHALALARRGFEAGRFSYAAMAQAQDTLLTLRRRGIDAAARFHTLLVEVERLTAVTAEETP
jgi:cobalt-zinc-cadmium efflux system outer membrane protein